MSAMRVCDWCRQPIDDREPRVALMTLCGGIVRGTTPSTAGMDSRDYHDSAERDCFAELLVSIEAAHEVQDAVRGAC